MKHRIKALHQEYMRLTRDLEVEILSLNAKIRYDVDKLASKHHSLTNIKANLYHLRFIIIQDAELKPEVIKFIDECEAKIIEG